jgi:hypothetical protein
MPTRINNENISRIDDRRVHARFRRKHRIDANGCWIWTATCDRCGYGAFSHNGVAAKAHRVSWRIHNGDIPSGMCVLHTCDVRNCVNPDHLFLGTQTDNMHDMANKNRSPVGIAHYKTKFDESAVRTIRARWAAGERQVDLAAEFNVNQSVISKVVRRRTWSHIP